MASLLERACDGTDHGEVEQALQAVTGKLGVVIQGLSTLDTPAVAPELHPPGTGGHSDTTQLLRELSRLVSSSNIRSWDVARKLVPLFDQPPQREKISEIRRAIRTYDFDAAQDELARLAQDLPIDPQGAHARQ